MSTVSAARFAPHTGVISVHRWWTSVRSLICIQPTWVSIVGSPVTQSNRFRLGVKAEDEWLTPQV